MNDRNTQENNHQDRTHRKNYGRMILFLYGCTMLGLYHVLPRFLSSASKAKASEARNYIGMAVRAQQEYFLETNSFSRKLESWGTNLPSETDNYSYRILFPSYPTVTEIAKTEDLNAIAIAVYPKVQKPKYAAPKQVFLGIVWTAIEPAIQEAAIRSAICESELTFEELKAERENKFWFLNFPYPSQQESKFSCPTGFKNL